MSDNDSTQAVESSPDRDKVGAVVVPQPPPAAVEVHDAFEAAAVALAADDAARGLPVIRAVTLAAQIEALLFVSAEPAPVSALAAALDASIRDVEAALFNLEDTFRDRGVRLQRIGNRVQLVSAPEMAARVQKFLGLEAVNRLSTAALETLAIIAYKQPVTKPQIEMIRGVNCDGVMHTLIHRNLVQELGRSDAVGHPMRYGVSFEFLQYFGLHGTHELPHVENLTTVRPLPVNAPDSKPEPSQAST